MLRLHTEIAKSISPLCNAIEKTADMHSFDCVMHYVHNDYYGCHTRTRYLYKSKSMPNLSCQQSNIQKDKKSKYQIKHTYVDYFACSRKKEQECSFSFENFHPISSNIVY
jgi:hypothetical protein